MALPLGAYFIYKKFFSSEPIVWLQNDSTSEPVSITDTRASEIAVELYNALSGFTENELKVMQLLEPLNKNDYVKVSSKFGVVNLIPFYNFVEYQLYGNKDLSNFEIINSLFVSDTLKKYYLACGYKL